MWLYFNRANSWEEIVFKDYLYLVSYCLILKSRFSQKTDSQRFCFLYMGSVITVPYNSFRNNGIQIKWNANKLHKP